MKKIIFFVIFNFAIIVYADQPIQTADEAAECVRLNFKTPRCKPYKQKTISLKSKEDEDLELLAKQNQLSYNDDNGSQPNKVSAVQSKIKSDKKSTINISNDKLTNFASNFQSTYVVERGDTLGEIAIKFGVAQGEIKRLNPSQDFRTLAVGTELLMPLPQDQINAIVNMEKRKLASIKEKKDEYKIISEPEGRKLRVIASAYTSHVAQSDSTPFIAAWGHHLIPGEKVIAVSRDLISEYGLANGFKVRISGLDGYYTVRDKMNPRYTKHIDIYMGVDKSKALRWGRRSVTIYW